MKQSSAGSLLSTPSPLQLSNQNSRVQSYQAVALLQQTTLVSPGLCNIYLELLYTAQITSKQANQNKIPYLSLLALGPAPPSSLLPIFRLSADRVPL